MLTKCKVSMQVYINYKKNLQCMHKFYHPHTVNTEQLEQYFDAQLFSYRIKKTSFLWWYPCRAASYVSVKKICAEGKRIAIHRLFYSFH